MGMRDPVQLLVIPYSLPHNIPRRLSPLSQPRPGRGGELGVRFASKACHTKAKSGSLFLRAADLVGVLREIDRIAGGSFTAGDRQLSMAAGVHSTRDKQREIM